jgi:nitrogen fixation protein FixH
MMAQPKQRELTGRMVLAITVSAFGVIIAVNVVMAWFAVETFPGLEVRNSYVASQGFNERLAAQRALGWQSSAEMRDRTLRVEITDAQGRPARVAEFTAILGRPTTEREDMTPDFVFDGRAWVAQVDVDYGNWDLRLTATAPDGTEFSQRLGLVHTH